MLPLESIGSGAKGFNPTPSRLFLLCRWIQIYATGLLWTFGRDFVKPRRLSFTRSLNLNGFNM